LQDEAPNPVTSRQAIPASFEKGRRLQVEGRLAEAASVFRSVLETEPGHVDALLCLVAIALRDGDEPAARNHFLEAAEHAPSDFRPRHKSPAPLNAAAGR
jgi:Flp pilus assembly protein TadD